MLTPDQIKSAVAWLTPFDIDITITPDHIEAIQVLLSIAEDRLKNGRGLTRKEIKGILEDLVCDGTLLAYTDIFVARQKEE